MNSASESAFEFHINIQNKPERWHKLTATLWRSQLLEGVCVCVCVRFHGRFVADFVEDFLAEFSVDFVADFLVDFLADLWQTLLRISRRIFRRIFPWILLEKLPKPCQTKDLRDKNIKKFLLRFSLLVGSLLFSGCAVDPAIAPLQTLEIPGVAGRHATMAMLRGTSMLICSSFSVYFPINLQGATEQLQATVRSKAALIWAIPPVRLGLSGRNSGKIPERPRKRSQSVSWNFPREYGWDPPNPIIQGI